MTDRAFWQAFLGGTLFGVGFTGVVLSLFWLLT